MCKGLRANRRHGRLCPGLQELRRKLPRYGKLIAANREWSFGKACSASEPDTRCQHPILLMLCPTGKSVNWLSSPDCKNILRPLRLTIAPNQWLSRTVPSRQEGRIARRHERGAGCGGRESVRRAWQSQGDMNLVSGGRGER